MTTELPKDELLNRRFAPFMGQGMEMIVRAAKALVEYEHARDELIEAGILAGSNLFSMKRIKQVLEQLSVTEVSADFPVSIQVVRDFFKMVSQDAEMAPNNDLSHWEIIVPAFVDHLINNVRQQIEQEAAAQAEVEGELCPHARARIDDGAPPDALTVSCNIVNLFAAQTGDTTPLICPGCGKHVTFRTWRPCNAAPMKITNDDGVIQMGHALDLIGPWFQCTGCSGWGNFGYKLDRD